MKTTGTAGAATLGGGIARAQGTVQKMVMSPHVESYANELIPIIDSIRTYVNAHVAIYDIWRSYKGNAREEFDTYEGSSNQQLNILVENYNALANILESIVMAFLELDEDAGRKILSYYCRNRPEAMAALEANDPNVTAAREYYGV